MCPTHELAKIKVGYMKNQRPAHSSVCMLTMFCLILTILNYEQRAVMNMPSVSSKQKFIKHTLTGWKYYFEKWSGHIAMLSNHNPHYTCKRFHHQHSLPIAKRGGENILIFFSLPSGHSHCPVQLKQHFCGQIPHLCSFLEAINCPE